MSDHFDLVLGTANAAKARELRELLAPHGFRVQTLADLPDARTLLSAMLR